MACSIDRCIDASANIVGFYHPAPFRSLYMLRPASRLIARPETSRRRRAPRLLLLGHCERAGHLIDGLMRYRRAARAIADLASSERGTPRHRSAIWQAFASTLKRLTHRLLNINFVVKASYPAGEKGVTLFTIDASDGEESRYRWAMISPAAPSVLPAPLDVLLPPFWAARSAILSAGAGTIHCRR